MTEEESYRDYVDIESGLTTNSVLAFMYSAVGLWAFPLIAVVSFVAAAVAGHASRYASLFFLAMLVVGYCFAEVWRAYLFNTGIIHFLLITLAAAPLADRFVTAWALPRVRALAARPRGRARSQE